MEERAEEVVNREAAPGDQIDFHTRLEAILQLAEDLGENHGCEYDGRFRGVRGNGAYTALIGEIR